MLSDYLDLLDEGMLTRAFLTTDPVTGLKEFSLFTDDGRGNGNHIVTISAVDLIKAYSRQLELETLTGDIRHT